MASGSLKHALEYAKRYGWKLFACHGIKDGACTCGKPDCTRKGKHPAVKAGVKAATNDPEELKAQFTNPAFNIGLATGDGLLVVDIDTDEKKGKQGRASWAALIGDNELQPTLTSQTGSGGLHVFYRVQEALQSKTSALGKDIDIRAEGGYVILPPSKHEYGTAYKWIEKEGLADAPDFILSRLRKPKPEAKSSEQPAETGPKYVTADRTRELLKYVDPDDRDTWWQVGAALKALYGEKGYDLWDEYSQRSPKHDALVLQQQWGSFNETSYTLATIVHYAKKGGFPGWAESLAQSMSEGWVYVAATKRFVNLVTRQELDKESYNDKFRHLIDKITPAEASLKSPNFRKVDTTTFLPKGEEIVEEDGLLKLNYWRPAPVAAVAGAKEPRWFTNHLDYLLPDGRESLIVLDWLSFCVQEQGEKIHWSIVLQGKQGNGKSFLGSVMKAVLGESNVRTLHSEQLHEQFTGWQKSTQLVIIEELMARGRLELMNKLKPIITERTAIIREMYTPPYEQPNRFNLLCFTNHKDAIVIDETDRRYCILASPADPQKPDYYRELFGRLKTEAGELAGWLGERTISESFNAKGHAPMTNAKRELIEDSKPNLEAWIEEAIGAREWPFNVDIVSPTEIAKVCQKLGFKLHDPRSIGRALKRIGAEQLGRMRSEGEERVYLYAIRNVAMYQAMSTSKLKEAYRQQIIQAEFGQPGGIEQAKPM